MLTVIYCWKTELPIELFRSGRLVAFFGSALFAAAELLAEIVLIAAYFW